MSEFKTVGPTQFGVGDGETRKFSVGRPGDVVQSANIESVRKVGWQGDVLLSPRPRTNLALFSNDFTNPVWNYGSIPFITENNDSNIVTQNSENILREVTRWAE